MLTTCLPPYLPLLTLLFLLFTRQHLLMLLLLLESTMLLIILLFPLFNPPSSLFLIPALLTLSACEASLGLSLLVMITRTTGTDMVKTLSVNKC